jgi:ribosomal protein S18 acetylase RimI-like enzyme
MTINLRPYNLADLPAMSRLYHASVHRVASRDYTPVEVAAWAPEQLDLERWRQKLATQTVIIAEIEGQMAGFCSWESNGYVDFLYVSPDHQRMGVASTLYAEAERSILSDPAIKRLHAQVSITAQPFFLSRGYKVVKHQRVHVRGVDLSNAVMEKILP